MKNKNVKIIFYYSEIIPANSLLSVLLDSHPIMHVYFYSENEITQAILPFAL